MTERQKLVPLPPCPIPGPGGGFLVTMPDEPTEGVLARPLSDDCYKTADNTAIPAVSLAECRRREAIAGNRGCWNLTTITPLVHVDGCECVAGDGFMLDPDEPTDPRCTEGEPYAAVVLDDGQYTLAVINLTAYAKVVEEAIYGEGSDGELRPILIEPDGEPCGPILSTVPSDDRGSVVYERTEVGWTATFTEGDPA